MRKRLSALFGLCLLSWTPPVWAHEFWISPEAYVVAPGSSISAAFRVGENLKGSAYSYIDRNAAQLRAVWDGGDAPISARMGDRPAIKELAAPLSDGLVVLVHETTDSTLTYREWEKFQNFAKHKDFPDAIARHRARGLPETGFKESYRRFAKALIAVGDGAGADRVTGLETEIVALKNPYTGPLDDGMRVRVLYQGDVRPDAQVELFEKAPDGTVTVALYRTDEQGEVVFPVQAGYEYLVDAVVLRDTGNDDLEAGAVWHSLWASLTFAVPG